jgi:hypothetical protein
MRAQWISIAVLFSIVAFGSVARADIAPPPDAAPMGADAGDASIADDAAATDDGGTSAISESKVGGCAIVRGTDARGAGVVMSIAIGVAIATAALRRARASSRDAR